MGSGGWRGKKESEKVNKGEREDENTEVEEGGGEGDKGKQGDIEEQGE